MHVNIWSADPFPPAVIGEVPGLIAAGTVLSGPVADRDELEMILVALRRLRVRVVSVEVEP